ncbi:DUF2079 domain-containing protein [Brachybacterium muris]|uniref:Membrane protein n=1 Tax=Brachybacterium muris UCD-AY4 TaxID=1249481 RepID=A0A022L0G5_9MICO|nr:DUF2079 domain-containing protein [Brachybacterium muris]EYT50776.1 membrane protein [Brachybacterium muris UCD-AY4]
MPEATVRPSGSPPPEAGSTEAGSTEPELHAPKGNELGTDSAALWTRRLVPPLLAVLATLAYGLLGSRQWRNLVSPSWDLGIFTQLARAYGEFGAPIVPIKGDEVNLLGDHFHPILVLLAPVWWAWPSGEALLWTQALLFGISAIPLTRVAIDRLGPGLGSAAGAAYVFSFGLQAAADVQFHEIAFAVPLLAFSLSALLRERIGLAVAWAAPLVLVKEDLGLTVAVLGAVIALRHRTHRREGLGLASWGIGWFVLSTFVVLPILNTAGQYDYTDNLGSPLDVFWPPLKWMTVGMLLLAAGLIGARSPLIWLMVPTLAWRFTGTVEFYWDWYWHYNAVLMPIALAALLDALGDRRTGRATAWLRTNVPRPARTVRITAVAASATVTLVLGASMPLLDLAREHTWERTWRAAPAQEALDAVPDGAVLASDITLLAQAVPDHDVQWVHGPNQRVPDCVLSDRYAFSWGDRFPEDPAGWAQGRWGASYATVLDEGGFIVVCRN